MKKAKAIWLLILLVVPVLLLSGCESVTKRADTQDTWNRIERRKRVIVGLDDSFVPMGFRQKMASWLVMMSILPGLFLSSMG